MTMLRELFAFLRVNNTRWLPPIVLVFVALGTLVVLAQGSVLAPLIYLII
jgi:hypothetical protein